MDAGGSEMANPGARARKIGIRLAIALLIIVLAMLLFCPKAYSLLLG